MWLLEDLIGSIITTLCIPYLLLKSLFPLLEFSHSVNPAIERFIWPALLALIAVWFMAKQTYDLVSYFHRLVFDDRYVVGERVDNLTEDILREMTNPCMTNNDFSMQRKKKYNMF